MKLSFVIPAYNEELNVGKCLESVFRELGRGSYDAEVIVVNNASTDRTGEIASSFPGVKVVDQPIKGLVHARHAGFQASNGDIIANIDSDTMLTPGWIDKVMSEFSKNPKLVGLSGPFIYHDVPASVRQASNVFYRLGYVLYLVNRFVLKVGSMLQGGNFIVRRSTLIAAGGFDTSIAFYGEDADIARRLNPLGDVKFTFKLPIYASGRRLMKEGVFVMGFKYMKNYLATIFLKRPSDREYIDIRVVQEGKNLTYQPRNRRKEFALMAAVALVLLSVLGTTGFLVATQVNAKESPKAFAIRMYHKFSDGDNDLQQIRLHIRDVFTRTLTHHGQLK